MNEAHEVEIFSVSDLRGGGLRKGEGRQRQQNGGRAQRRTRVSCEEPPKGLETSSFKLSNRLAVHGNKCKKPRTGTTNDIDLLWLHESKLKHFQTLQEVILPQKRKELEDTLLTDQERHRLDKEVVELENREEEITYLLKTQHILDRYMHIVEEETETSMKPRKDNLACSGSLSSNTIMKLGIVTELENKEKELLTEEYCQTINHAVVDRRKLLFDTTKCTDCGEETVHSEGFVTCTSCGVVAERSIPEFRLSYSDYQDTVVRSTFAYKRINRFREILNTLQAKENSVIPDYVIAAVWEEINKERDPDISAIDTVMIRRYLKRLSLTSYYERAPSILVKINDIPPVVFPSGVEEKLLKMFVALQEPYDKLKKDIVPNRESFLAYHFCLYKLMELLDLHEFKKHFTRLKSEEKLRLQDKIWEAMCESLGWEFIPSF